MNLPFWRVVYLTYISSKYPSLAALSQFTRVTSVYIYAPTNHSSTSNSCHLLSLGGDEGGSQGLDLEKNSRVATLMAIMLQIFTVVACFPLFLMSHWFIWTIHAINIDGNTIDGWKLHCLVQWVKERKPHIVSSLHHHYCEESISVLKSGIFLVLVFVFCTLGGCGNLCFTLFMFTGLPVIAFPCAMFFFFLFLWLILYKQTVSVVKRAEVRVSVTHKQEHISPRW